MKAPARPRTAMLCLHKTPLPVCKPTLNPNSALATKKPFSTTPRAAAFAASLLIKSIANLPSRPNACTNICMKAKPMESVFLHCVLFAASYAAIVPHTCVLFACSWIQLRKWQTSSTDVRVTYQLLWIPCLQCNAKVTDSLSKRPKQRLHNIATKQLYSIPVSSVAIFWWEVIVWCATGWKCTHKRQRAAVILGLCRAIQRRHGRGHRYFTSHACSGFMACVRRPAPSIRDTACYCSISPYTHRSRLWRNTVWRNLSTHLPNFGTIHPEIVVFLVCGNVVFTETSVCSIRNRKHLRHTSWSIRTAMPV